VTLVSGPTALKKPAYVETVDVVSAQDMFEAVTARAPEQDIIIKAAAVADYRPAQVAQDKVKKGEGELSIPLERTRDILAWLGEHRGPGQFLCGFSMETRDMVENSRRKLEKKHLDLIAANPDAIFMVWYNGYTVNDTDYAGEQVVELITENPAFASLDAVKNGKIAGIPEKQALLPVKKIVAGKLVFPIHKLQITAVSGIGRQFHEHGRGHKQGVRPAPAVLAARSQELEGSGGRPVHHLVQHGANLFSCGGIAVFHRHLHLGMPHGMVVRMIMPIQGLPFLLFSRFSQQRQPRTFRNGQAILRQAGIKGSVSPMLRRTSFRMLRLPFRHQLKVVPDGLFIPVRRSSGNRSSCGKHSKNRQQKIFLPSIF